MKLLLDTCVWGGAKPELQALGHDVIWCGDWSEDPGDEEVLTIAHRDQRVLVTLDKNFGELAVVRGRPHAGIVRLVGFAARDQANACARILTLHRDEIARGALVTATPGRLRVRPREEES